MGWARATQELLEGRADEAFWQAVRAQLAAPQHSMFFSLPLVGFHLHAGTRLPDDVAREIRRVLKPGGRLLVLEFSKPSLPGLAPLYDLYSFRVLPLMGRLIARDADSYRYLAESIRMHPDQDTLKGMMEQAGFEDCDYLNLSGGIVAVHRGFRF